MSSALLYCLVTLLLGSALVSCRKPKLVPGVAASPAPPGQPTFRPQGIEVSLKASDDLNLFEDSAHAILVVIYQLSATNAFNEMAKDPVGVQALLKGARFDPSVASVDKIFLQPGQDMVLPLDRAQYGKWFAVAAGYYDLAPGGATRILELPDTVPGARQARQHIQLLLGRDAITNALLR